MKRVLFCLAALSAALILLAPSLASAATPKEVGVSERATNHISRSAHSSKIRGDARFKNALIGLEGTRRAPSGATVVRNEAQLHQMRSGGVYVVRGNVTVNRTVKVPGNVSIYVEGSVYKRGTFSGGGENKRDVIFEIDGRSNVAMYGVNNASVSSNGRSVGFLIQESRNVTIDGFQIKNTWEAVSAQWNADRVTVTNNHIVNTERRAVWLLGADNAVVAHNFMEDIGMDGVDFDFVASDGVAFENVVISAGRWCGFVEEGAARNKFVRNVCIMATFDRYRYYQMGWADNGTTADAIRHSGGKLTRDNYFIDNVVYQSSKFQGGSGDYFAKQAKGMTYFWGNDAYGAGRGGLSKAVWTNDIPLKGRQIIANLDAAHNDPNPNPNPNPNPDPDPCRSWGPSRARAEKAFGRVCGGLERAECKYLVRHAVWTCLAK